MNDDEQDYDDGTRLMIAIMQQNARDAAFTTNALLEGYKRDYEEAKATVQAIRRGIIDLFAGGYMPTESAIMRALYPYVD